MTSYYLGVTSLLSASPASRALSVRAREMTASAIREILKVTADPEVISFAGGLPAPELFPVEEVRAAADRVLSEFGPAALQYSTTEGHLPLRRWIAESQGIAADNVQIVTGSQQGLDLLGRVLIDPGDVVLVEEPTYLGALQAFTPYQPRYATIETDAEGLDVAALEHRLQAADHSDRAKLLYLVPNFANPTGRTLTLQRRRDLVELTARHGVLIIEDDPYGQLRFRGDPVPSLFELALQYVGGDVEASHVVRCSSFSKTLAPGLREGWVQGATPIIRKLVMAKQGADLHTPTLDQLIVTELLADVLPRQIDRVRRTYGERAAIMTGLLDDLLGDRIARTDPEGGMFCWVELLDGTDSTDLLERTVRRNLAFVPGVSFYPAGNVHNCLRLNYTCSTPEQLATGLGILADELR